jgi:CheY-like chemotaxis protein
MPGMDGWEFIKEYALFPEAILQQSSVIMLTSSINVCDMKIAKLNPLIDDYISKPLSIENFSAVTNTTHQQYSLR